MHRNAVLKLLREHQARVGDAHEGEMVAATIASGIEYFVHGWRHLAASATR